jgi:hypothetical protein
VSSGMKFIMIVLMFLSGFAWSKSDDSEVIKQSFKLSPHSVQSKEGSLKATQYLKKRRIIAREPNYVEEYANIYILSKDVMIFDAKLTAYIHDYMTERIGCCVRYGVSLVLKRSEAFDQTEINAFADKNACIVETFDDIYFLSNEVLSALKIKGHEENFLLLSCREGDSDVLSSKHQNAEIIGNEKELIKEVKTNFGNPEIEASWYANIKSISSNNGKLIIKTNTNERVKLDHICGAVSALYSDIVGWNNLIVETYAQDNSSITRRGIERCK